MYNEKELHKKALKCKNRTEFSLKYPSAYRWAVKNKKLNQVFSGIPRNTTKKYFFTKKNVLAIAKKCSTRTEFLKACPSAYLYAKKNNFFKEYISHMLRPSTRWTADNLKELTLKYTNLNKFISENPGGIFSNN